MRTLRGSLELGCLALACILSVATGARAQVLARPGWAGSGVAHEVWWQRAVFYRIRPALFQDSTGSGTGDLRGVEQRVDYLRQLGVDAIVLVPPFAPDGVADLARAASQAHIRVLVQMNAANPAEARHWLLEGAAGVLVETGPGSSPALASDLLEVRRVCDSFPGQRVLATLGADGGNAPELSGTGAFSEPGPGGLAAAEALRGELQTAVSVASAGALVHIPRVAGSSQGGATSGTSARAFALLALGSRAAVLLDAGTELGLIPVSANAPVLMQWTPRNITPPPPAPIERRPPGEVYGRYTPYVPPPKFVLPPPRLPNVVESATLPPNDPNTLPGFTSGALPGNGAANGATANVALEDRDGDSLLNFYRRLIALHRGNPALRDGAETVLDAHQPDVILWVRRAPEGTRTSASVVAAANLSGSPVDLPLLDDLRTVGLRGTTVRPLLVAPEASQQRFPAGGRLVLAPYAVYLGELHAPGGRARPSRYRR